MRAHSNDCETAHVSCCLASLLSRYGRNLFVAICLSQFVGVNTSVVFSFPGAEQEQCIEELSTIDQEYAKKKADFEKKEEVCPLQLPTLLSTLPREIALKRNIH